ncbi:hypothetical protein CMI37_06115 [Candidatus Pacearchaeota archaeon]|nr:hypothetical protein [Candidatus Pacearchaeota archaeon]|tara:strand:- start:1132 stop:1443 length:312 start_codon:yes stop_codon:yes gene_type:complete
MVLEKAIGKAKRIREIDDIRKARQENIDYVFNNRQELVESFPNKWMSVIDGAVELADDDMLALYHIISGREPNAGRIFYLSNLIEPALILIRPTEVEYDSSKT